ncbi:SRPBCC family protein [bacterium]|nr:SRPBCC family protein [bacterium]
MSGSESQIYPPRNSLLETVRMILRVFLIFILIILILAMIAPKQYHVERSIEIQAPAVLVFEQIRFWDNWEAWSPWADMEPAMAVSIQGRDGAAGSEYHWTGKRTGSGWMTHLESRPPERFAYHVRHIKPLPGKSEGVFLLEESGGITKASWIYRGRTPMPWNIMNLFVSMDKIAGRDFERGLILLRDLCEKKAVLIAGYPVQEVSFQARNFAAMRRSCTRMEARPFIEESIPRIMDLLSSRGIRQAGIPCGLFFTEDSLLDVAAAVPVIRWTDSGSIREMRLPSSRAFRVEYEGPEHDSICARLALDRHFARNRLRRKPPVMEEYPDRPEAGGRPGNILLRVYFFVQSDSERTSGGLPQGK